MKGRPLGAGRRRGAAGVAAVALAFGASTGEAAAEKISVTNTAEKGRGSFAAATRRADSDGTPLLVSKRTQASRVG